MKYLSVYLKTTVEEDEVLLVFGYYGNCNPELSFYAERKAIMVDDYNDDSAQELESVLSRLREERIGAIVCCGKYFEENEQILNFLKIEGFSTRPSFIEGRLWKAFLREDKILSLIDESE